MRRRGSARPSCPAAARVPSLELRELREIKSCATSSPLQVAVQMPDAASSAAAAADEDEARRRDAVAASSDAAAVDEDEERRRDAIDNDDDNEMLGAAMKAIASEKRRRAQRAEEIRPERGVKVSWRRSVRVYVTPTSARGYVDTWLVAADHFSS